MASSREVFDLTREYVGEDVLPNIEGWSHFADILCSHCFGGERR